MPVELWRLCAVEHHGIGHRIRLFCARAQGDKAAAAMLVLETDRIDQPGLAGVTGARAPGVDVRAGGGPATGGGCRGRQ